MKIKTKLILFAIAMLLMEYVILSSDIIGKIENLNILTILLPLIPFYPIALFTLKTGGNNNV